MRKLIYIASFFALVGCGKATTQYSSPSSGSTGTVCTQVAMAAISGQIHFGTGFTAAQFQVKVQDGAYSETLSSYASGTGELTFGGAYERAGTYTVTVSYPGATTQTRSNVAVTAGECHVSGQAVSFNF